MVCVLCKSCTNPCLPLALLNVPAFLEVQDLISHTAETEEVRLHRSEIATAFMHLYDTETLLTKRLNVCFLGEDGLDYGGLTKEFFTLTWATVFESYFTGEDAAVPHLPLHRLRQDEKRFVQIGRLLCHTIGLLGQVPPRLCRTTLLQLTFGEEEISDEILLPDFLMYLCRDDRALIERALADYDYIGDRGKDQLLHIYSVHGMQVRLCDDFRGPQNYIY